MKLSVIMPVYNEESTISKIIKKIRLLKNIDIELIVIDDFSNDNTRKILKSKSLNLLIDKIIFLDQNKGKGYACRKGIENSSGELIIVQDADLEYDPEEYPNMINPIVDNKADIVYGSRFKGGQPHRVVYFWHRVGNGFLTLLSNIFTDLNLSDMETCYKAFKSEIIKNIRIEEKRFGFEPEITAKVARKRFRIYEVGISYYGRTYEEGKKIGWRDGIRAIWCIIKYNLLIKN